MAQTAELDAAPATIDASVNYLLDYRRHAVDLYGWTRIDRGAAPSAPPIHTVSPSKTAAGANFALERDGFHFVRHDTKVADFFDAEEIQRVYYPEMEALVKAESGASRVVVFDHTLRTADDAFRETAQDSRSRAARPQ